MHRKPKKVKITSFDGIFIVPIEFDEKTQSNFNNGQAVSSTFDCTRGQIKHYTFETLIQRVNLTYIYVTKEVVNADRKTFPCLLMEGGCKTTFLNAFAYTWDSPQKCVMTKTLTQDTVILHYPLTTDQKENQLFFHSEFEDIGKGMNRKPKFFSESYKPCGKPERLYKKNFESLFVNYQGGFAMPDGELRTKKKSSNEYHFSIDNTSQIS